MELIRSFSRNRVTLLGLATLIIQSSVFVTATYITGQSPDLSGAKSVAYPSSDSPDVVDSTIGLIDPNAGDYFGEHGDLASVDGAVVEESPSVGVPIEDRPEVAHHRVRAGDTFSRIWKEHGAPNLGAVKAAEAVDKLKLGPSVLRPGDEIELQISPEKEITALRKKVGEGKILLLEGNSVLGFSAILNEEAVVEEERIAAGNIKHSFAAAATEVKLPVVITDQVVDLFSGRIEFRRDMQPGDTFSVVFTERKGVESGDIYPGPLNAASIVNAGEMLIAVRYAGADGKIHYYDDKGEAIGNYFYRYPLQFSRISSAFSKSRFHPLLQRALPHNGVDFAAPIGTPVRSVAEGVVTSAGRNGGSGIMIKIRHGERYETAYLHLSRVSNGIRVGSRVTRGQVIGSVGMTGLATGPHLHFSFYDRGRYVDPLSIELPKMPVDAEKIPADYLREMIDRLQQKHQEMVLAGNFLAFKKLV